MDPLAYPRLSKYVKGLPQGLLSYPECESKASLYREALSNLPRKLDTAGLDPLLASYVDDPVPVSSWVPEVVTNGIYLAIADQVFKDDERFLEWVGEFSRKVFESPLYRVLMSLASPQRLAQGATRRWQNFHTGVDYQVALHENGTLGHLITPPSLYDRLVLRAHLRAIQAAYRASGAPDATIEILSMNATDARFRIVWDPQKPGPT